MTIEQLEKGNKFVNQMNELRNFQMAFEDKYGENAIEAEYVKRRDEFTGHQTDERRLELRKYPELSLLILNYISVKIKGLEKQLEEL